jgi:hypothetical protein
MAPLASDGQTVIPPKSEDLGFFRSAPRGFFAIPTSSECEDDFDVNQLMSPTEKGTKPTFGIAATKIVIIAGGTIFQGNGTGAQCISGPYGSILQKAWPDGSSKSP